MKYKTTDKQQRENNYIVIGIGYCNIRHITQYIKPTAYTCGVYGWRADFYEFDSFTISTGYDPLDYAQDKVAKKRAVYIKREILKLEKALEARKYAFQKSHDWNKGHKFITAKINKIYQDAAKAIQD